METANDDPNNPAKNAVEGKPGTNIDSTKSPVL